MPDTIYYLAVDRDDAKQLFATKEPQALRILITDWVQSFDVGAQLLQLGDSWAQLKDLLPASDEQAQFAITSLFEGNRQLLDEDGFRVCLVRPDAAGAVVHFLSEVDPVGPAAARATQADLNKFFSSAVEARQAVAIVHTVEAMLG